MTPPFSGTSLAGELSLFVLNFVMIDLWSLLQQEVIAEPTDHQVRRGH